MRLTVPIDRDGIHHGSLMIPHSGDESAWGHVVIPLCVVQNGEGPTALVTGGNHGDEFEGPLAVTEFARSVDLNAVRGRIILIPALNRPAFEAQSRTSPIDGGNLNRSFPGDATGTVTEKIAAFVNDTLIPMADLVLDFHSGGKTLDFLPFAASHVLPDTAQDAASAAAARAFGAPYTLRMLEIDDGGMLDGAAERAGKVFVTTELGGGGTLRPETAAIACRGLRNVLVHAGCLTGQIDAQPTQALDMPDETCFAFADAYGIADYALKLGDRVKNGQEILRIWPVDKLGVDPVPVMARRDGILTARHHPGLIKPGDCAAVIAVPV